jgi:hypothetical protein
MRPPQVAAGSLAGREEDGYQDLVRVGTREVEAEMIPRSKHRNEDFVRASVREKIPRLLLAASARL